MTSNRADYMRAYYLANRDRIKAKDKGRKRTRTDSADAQERYREKKRILREIEQMPHGPVWGGA